MTPEQKKILNHMLQTPKGVGVASEVNADDVTVTVEGKSYKFKVKDIKILGQIEN